MKNVLIIGLLIFSTPIFAQKVQYTYDKAGRLSEVTYPNLKRIIYTYDNDGNRISKTISTLVLPIELLSFDATKQGKEVLLSWATSQEINSDKFEIEFSKDGISFDKFVTVAANGSTSSRTNYSTIHCCPVTGVNYYRLKMIDKNGEFKYSEIRKIKFDFINEMKVYPNPVSGLNVLSISFVKSFDSDATVMVYDAKGSLVINTNLFKGAISLPLNISNLTTGTYSIKVLIKEEIYTTVFVKQ